jgi:malonate transporter
MLRVLEVTFPVFALIFLGFLGQRRRMLPSGAIEALNAFVFQFALPAMIFRIVATQPPASFADWRFIGGFLSASLLIYGLSRWRTRAAGPAGPAGGARATAFALHVTHGNVGYLGVPLAIELGRHNAPPMILAMMCDIFVVIALSIALLEIDRKRQGTGDSGAAGGVAGTVVRGLARSPLVLSIAAGLAWSLLGPPLPAFADSFARILGGAAGPCALFAIGASLGDRNVLVNRTVGALVAAKLLLHPALAAVALIAFGCQPTAVAVGVLAASLPGASNSFIIASRYGVETKEISSATLVGSFVGLITVSLVIWWSGLGPQ